MTLDKMKQAKVALAALAVFAAAFTVSAGSVVGRFQREGASVLNALPLGGQIKARITAPEGFSLDGLDASDLALEMDIRVTRYDGASGFEAVKCIRNGQVFIYDTDGKEVFRADSPVMCISGIY